MATLTGNIEQKAQMAAKAAYDAELAACMKAGFTKEEAHVWAVDAGADAYDVTLDGDNLQ